MAVPVKRVVPDYPWLTNEVAFFGGDVTRILGILMNPDTPERILQQIAQIKQMERGKLSAYHFKKRPGKTGPYYKLQQHLDGRNQTRHIRPEEVPGVRAALAGYRRFQALVEQYVRLMIERTRVERAADLEKRAH